MAWDGDTSPKGLEQLLTEWRIAPCGGRDVRVLAQEIQRLTKAMQAATQATKYRARFRAIVAMYIATAILWGVL